MQKQEIGNQVAGILKRRDDARTEMDRTQKEMLHLILSQNMMEYVKIDWPKLTREFITFQMSR